MSNFKHRDKLILWQQKFDDLELRERLLLAAVVFAVVIMALQSVFLDGVMEQRQQLNQQAQSLQRQIRQQQGEQQILSAQLQVGVNRKKIQQRDQLQQQLAQLNLRIENSVVGMIPPQKMPQVLEQLLAKSQGLKLISLENKPVVALVEQQVSADQPINSPPGPQQEPQQGLYRHGFILRLSGNYSAAISYFDQLKTLPWRFYWDQLHYQVDDYPNAIITLEVHTVSMDQEWIGV